MSFINKSQLQASGPVSFTMDKDLLKIIPKIAADPFYSNDQNWYRVSFIFKHTDSRRRFVPSFKNFSATKILKIRSGMNGGDQFTLRKIILSKSDRSHLVIWENEIPDISIFNFALLEGGEQPDLVRPSLSSITSPAAGQYTSGDLLNFYLNFDENVVVTGQPKLYLDVGFVYKEASYVSGSGNQSLLFRYTVGNADNDAEGIELDSFNLNGGSIKDVAGNNALINVSSFSLNPITIYNDVTKPVISQISSVSGNYFFGDEISLTVSFSESVTVSGSPKLNLTINNESKQAVFFSKISDSQLVFKYTVMSEDTGSMTIESMNLNGGTISDSSGNDATITFSSQSQSLALNPDYISPAIQSVTSGSQALYTGDVLEVSVTFSEPVLVAGAPYASAIIGESTKTLEYNRTEGSKVIFNYTVAAGNFAQNNITFSEIVIPADSSIKDASGNDANISFASTVLNIPVNPDYVAPIIYAVRLPYPSAQNFFVGEEVTFEAEFSEIIQYTGSPRLELIINSQTKYAEIDSSNSYGLYFKYTVAAEDIGTIIVVSMDLNGGTIKDQYNNSASIQISPVVPLMYDAENSVQLNPDIISPTVVSVSGTEGDYVTGDSIEFTVDFSENIQVSGTGEESLVLTLDSGTVNAYISNVSGSTATFSYTVGEQDEELENLTISSISLGSNGFIKDLANNPANLDFGGSSVAVTINENNQPQLFRLGVAGLFDGTIYSILKQSDGKLVVGGNFTTYNDVYVKRIARLNADGSLDSSFVIGTGFNSTVYSIVQQSDGKLVVGGAFTSYNGTSINRIVRLNTDGSLDSSFVVGTGFNSDVYSIAQQSDGKLVVGGNFSSYNSSSSNYIIRLNTNGSADSSFVIGVGFSGGAVRCIIQQSDGKLVVGGAFTSYNGTNKSRLVRLDLTGSIDSSFQNTTFNDTIYSIVQQSNGKLAVGGAFTTSNGAPADRMVILDYSGYVDIAVMGASFKSTIWSIIEDSNNKLVVGGAFSTVSAGSRDYIVRLNADGSIDSSFVVGTGFNSAVYSVVEQSETSYVVGGSFTSYNAIKRNRIVRIDINGNIDFDTFKNNSGFNSRVNFIFQQSDGKLVVGGDFTNYNGTSINRIARLNTNGSIDSSFVIGTGFNGMVYSTVQQPDGKLVIGGDFTNYNGTIANKIARLNTDGSLDSSFVVGTGFNTAVLCIIQQSDGKLVVGGSFSSYNGVAINKIARLNTDGSIDSSFVVGTGFNTDVNSIIQQPDGKLVVGGNFTSYNGVAINKIARLNTDGSIDSSFVVGAGFDNTVYSIVQQSDGKLVVGGAFTSYNGTAVNKIAILDSNGLIAGLESLSRFSGTVNCIIQQPDGKLIVGGSFLSYNGITSIKRIVRLNTDGSADNSFVVNTGFDGTVSSIVQQPDGKLVVGGAFSTYNGTSVNKIARLNADGSIDNSFAVGTGFLSTVSSIIQQSDGKLVVGGAFTTYNGTTANRIVRLNTNGSIDSSFAVGTGFNNTVNFIIQQSDGKLVVGGSFTSYNGTTSINRIVRLNTNGSIDSSFVIGTGLNAGFNNAVSCIIQQSDGKLVVGGIFTNYRGTSRNGIVRLNADGSLDSSFAVGTGLGGTLPYVRMMKQQSNGKLVVVGEFASYNSVSAGGIVRLNADGSIDSSFVIGTAFGSVPFVYSIIQQSDGKLVVGGTFTTYNGTTANRIIILNTDGSVDSNLFTETRFNGGNVQYIIQQPDGKLVMGGNFTSYNGVARNGIVRLNTNGSIDSSFAVGTGFPGTVNCIIQQPDGKLVVGGNFSSYNSSSSNYIVRLNTDGSLDNSFAVGTGFNSAVYSIAQQSDGKLVVSGNFTSYNGTNKSRLVRLNADGSLDSSFAVGTGFDNIANFIIRQSDGKLVVGGSFTSYNGAAANRLVRLNADGSADNNLLTTTRFNFDVLCVIQQPDGKLVVGGTFTTYNGTTANRIVRLNADGSIDSSFIPEGLTDVVTCIIQDISNNLIIGGDWSGGINKYNLNGNLDYTFATNIGTGFPLSVRGIKSIIQQFDGKLVVGGTFTSYNSISFDRIIRLESNGALEII